MMMSVGILGVLMNGVQIIHVKDAHITNIWVMENQYQFNLNNYDNNSCKYNQCFMKELTIEQKAQRYDEALKVLHKYDGANIMFSQSLKEEMFPELKESEDERIRRVIRGWIYTRPDSFFDNGISKEEMLAWLEKQKPDDKVEPKFEIKEGKWYVCIRDLLDNYANKAFYKGDIYLSTQNGSLIPSNSNVPFKVVCPDTYFKDWAIQDAKPGDVLASKDGDEILIFRNLYSNTGFSSYYNIKGRGEIGWSNRSFIPATKEQRKQLEKAMADVGYTFDFEKKELKKIEKNSAWSEEKMRLDAIKYLELFDAQGIHGNKAVPCINWLKSLKDRYTWKPSDEQVIELRRVISGCSYDIEPLVELETKLKEL